MAALAEIRIVLLGKSGSGKSSVGNVILGEEKFEALPDPNSVSTDCQTEEGNLYGRRITVTDTPGLFDTDSTRSEKDLKYSIISCLTECAPGPHVFILVMKVDRYTKEEKESVKMILQYFGEEALKHTVVLFTHGDDLGRNQTIKNFVERNKDLKELVDKCGGRVHVVDSKHWIKKDGQSEDLLKEMIKQKGAAGELQAVQAREKKKNRLCGCGFRFRLKQRSSTPDKEPSQGSGRPSSSGGNLGGSEYRSNSFQIKQLLTTIDTMVRDNGDSYYRNETLQVIAEAIKNEENKLKEELDERGEKAEVSEIKRKARERVRTSIWNLLIGSTTGVLLGALLGVPVGVTIVILLKGTLLMKIVTRAGAGGTAGAAGAAGTEAGASAALEAGAAGTAGAEGGASAALEAGAAGTAGAEGGAGAAIGTGAYVAAGVFTTVGAIMGGAVGVKAAARADNVGEAAGNAAEAVVGGAWNMVKEAWEFSKKNSGL